MELKKFIKRKKKKEKKKKVDCKN